MRIDTRKIKRLVVKIGSSVLSDASGLKSAFFAHLAEQVAELKSSGVETVIVSSGAVAAAMAAFGQAKKPHLIPEKQAFAAYGQPLLMQHYTAAFKKKGLPVAQILLTHPDLENRNRFLNAKLVIDELLGRGIIPVVNENDSVVVEELKFGDNDRLSAYVSNVAEADLLVILSHVDGLYDGNPEKDANTKLIPIVEKVDSATGQLVFQNKNELGTGGMASKLEAAQIGLDFGIPVFITNGTKKGCLTKIFSSSAVGTYFQPNLSPLSARKHWISKVLKPKGEIVVDTGAKDALTAKKRSLLPSGVKAVKGHFERGDCIAVNDVGGKLVAKGLALYSWWEVEKIMGRKSIEIEKILGYKYADEIIHRDDLVVLDFGRGS